LNFIYIGKDREEVNKRTALMNIKSYRHWRFRNGLPCRGQRTKTNASTAHYRIRGGLTAKEKLNIILKSKRKFEKGFTKKK